MSGILSGVNAFLSNLLIASIPFEFAAPHTMDECQSLLEGMSREARLFVGPGLQVAVFRESANTGSFQVNETGPKAILHMVGYMEETAQEVTSVQGQVKTEMWMSLVLNTGLGLILIIGLGIVANSTPILFLGPLLVVCGVLVVAVMARLVNHPRELALIQRVKKTLDAAPR